MREAVFAALTCVVRVQCVLCGSGPAESSRWFAVRGPLYCTAAEGGAKRGGLLFGSFPPVVAACSSAPGRPRSGLTSHFHAEKKAYLSLGGRCERREIIRGREERQPSGGAPGSERTTGGAAALRCAALGENRTTIPLLPCPDIPAELVSALS